MVHGFYQWYGKKPKQRDFAPCGLWVGRTNALDSPIALNLFTHPECTNEMAEKKDLLIPIELML